MISSCHIVYQSNNLNNDNKPNSGGQYRYQRSFK